MAEPRSRFDGYGRPLPELADAREEVLYQSETNQDTRRHLHALIDDYCHQVLRRGTYAEVTLTFDVVDGSIQHGIRSRLTRYWGRQRARGHEEQSL